MPKHPRDLAKHEMVKFVNVTENLVLTYKGQQTTVETQGRIKVDDMQTMKVLTLNGDGIGLMQNFLCLAEARQKKLIRVLPEWTWDRFGISFVYPPQRFVSPKTQTFIEWVLKNSETAVINSDKLGKVKG